LFERLYQVQQVGFIPVVGKTSMGKRSKLSVKFLRNQYSKFLKSLPLGMDRLMPALPWHLPLPNLSCPLFPLRVLFGRYISEYITRRIALFIFKNSTTAEWRFFYSAENNTYQGWHE